MRKILLALALAVILSSIAVPVRAEGSSPPLIPLCMDDGWQVLTDPATGSTFENQGQCVAHFAQYGELWVLLSVDEVGNLWNLGMVLGMTATGPILAITRFHIVTPEGNVHHADIPEDAMAALLEVQDEIEATIVDMTTATIGPGIGIGLIGENANDALDGNPWSYIVIEI
jgi:hypothetical protein